MKEKRSKEDTHKKNNIHKKSKNYPTSSSSSSDEWVEKESSHIRKTERADWMAMTGMLKTYTKDDIHPTKAVKGKNHIDSYNPATSTRELNPYWKDGGSGIPQTAERFRKSRQFLKPSEDGDDYTKCSDRQYSSKNSEYCAKKSSAHSSGHNRNDKHNVQNLSDDNDGKSTNDMKMTKEQESNKCLKVSDKDDDYYKKSYSNHYRSYDDRKCYNWKMANSSKTIKDPPAKASVLCTGKPESEMDKTVSDKSPSTSKYLSDEKMNKLAAKLVKAEILGDARLVAELKEKLEQARVYRKQNPGAEENNEEEGIMLIETNSSGNSRPLEKTSKEDAKSKGGKRKADTHSSGERAKYFGNDDKYNLAQMFTDEKYGNNFKNDAELARIASKSKNPNDDLVDLFMDEISKNHNDAKENDAEKNRAIKQHEKMERSLEGCEYCLNSKNMLKHLMVSCGMKVYVALPARRSLVKDHCLIATIQHATCVTAIDEDVWEEVLNYRKALTQYFDSQNKDVVFFETATRLHRFPHMVVSCVPLPRDVGDAAPVYFKKALLECEAEWSMNRKLVHLKGKTIRRGVPKGLPYFWIDFGMDSGFAHIIEDQQLFPKSFAEEIIGGILDLDHSLWKNPRKEHGDAQRKKVLDFLKEWRTFDPVKSQE